MMLYCQYFFAQIYFVRIVFLGGYCRFLCVDKFMLKCYNNFAKQHYNFCSTGEDTLVKGVFSLIMILLLRHYKLFGDNEGSTFSGVFSRQDTPFFMNENQGGNNDGRLQTDVF